jgi:hypothetical protein
MITETLDKTTKTAKIEIDRAQLTSTHGALVMVSLDAFITEGMELPANLAEQLRAALAWVLASKSPIEHVEIALDVPVCLKLVSQVRVEEIVEALRKAVRP